MSNDIPPPPPRLADGTQPGTATLIGTRVVAHYPWHHPRENVTERRVGVGRVAKVYPDGRVAVDTDRDGIVVVTPGDVEVCT